MTPEQSYAAWHVQKKDERQQLFAQFLGVRSLERFPGNPQDDYLAVLLHLEAAATCHDGTLRRDVAIHRPC